LAAKLAGVGLLKAGQSSSEAMMAKLDGRLLHDYQTLLDGHCKYMPQLLASATDLGLCERLAVDLEHFSSSTQGGHGMVEWSRHLKHEDPSWSPAFNEVVERMAVFFDVEVFASRLNFYRDGSDWKPFHHDSHAFSHGVKEDFTMGASFGSSRALAFLHEPSGSQFALPQHNGDVFAFTSEANKRFKHGVPRVKRAVEANKVGCRFSIIAWGRRRRLCKANSATLELSGGRSGGCKGGSENEEYDYSQHCFVRPIDQALGGRAPNRVHQTPPERRRQGPRSSEHTATTTTLQSTLPGSGGGGRAINAAVDVRPLELVQALKSQRQRTKQNGSSVSSANINDDHSSSEPEFELDRERNEQRRQSRRKQQEINRKQPLVALVGVK